jgi:hypothetical protein
MCGTLSSRASMSRDLRPVECTPDPIQEREELGIVGDEGGKGRVGVRKLEIS